MEKSKKPQIRFKGFTNDWEQRKLKEIADIIGGGTPDTNNLEYWNGDIDWYSPTEIGNEIYTNGSIRKITNLGLEKSSAKILPPNKTILFTSRAGIGDMAILRNFGTTNQGFQSLVLHDECNVYFVYSSGNRIKEYALKNASGSTFLEISAKQLGEMDYFIPVYEEQKKIGKYFETLDNLITLHQRKCEKLKIMKKSCLEKMFPKNNQKIPDVRFKGFTNDWEQRKLNKISTMHARIGWQNLRKSEFLKIGDYYLITGTDFIDGSVDFKNCYYVEKDRYEQDKNIQVHQGSILITKDGTLGKVAYIRELKKPATLNAGVFNVKIIDKKVDERYLFQYLKAPFLMNYVNKKATGGTIKHLNQNILVDFLIPLSYNDELKKIGKYFETLDNLITLHQRKVEKLKKIKKSCLEKMFV